jgi:putative ABC transport system permease protein
MGAGAGRLAAGTLAETVLVVTAGTIGGLLVSLWILDWIVAQFPEGLPYWIRFDLDRRVMLFTAGTAAAATVAIGLVPAWRATRPDLVADLRDAGRGASLGAGGRRLQSILAVAQIGLCLALLVGANLMVRSFLVLQRADLGFDDAPLLTARGYLAGDQYDDLNARAAFFDRAIGVLAALPGAASAAVTTALPGDDGGSPARIVVDGRTADGDELAGQLVGVSSRYFDALGVPVVEGRAFFEIEATNPDSDVALVSRPLADALWPDGNVLDRRVGIKGAQDVTWLRVVGVAPDLHYEEVGEQTEASRLSVYVPYARAGYRSVAFVVRASGDPRSLVSNARNALERMSAGFPVFRLMTMRELRRLTTWDQRFFGLTMAAFAGAAVLLACLGVYALVAYSVGRRSREIGVRIALGASPGGVVAMLLKENAVVAVVGATLGVLLGLAIARALGGAVYGVSTDAWLFVSMLAPLVAALFGATWLPARRAAHVDPTVALREE